MTTDKIIEVYSKLRFKRQPIDIKLGFNFGFEVQSKQLDVIVDVIAKMEKLFDRKLKILEIGTGQGFFTFELTKMGHDVTSIEWESENFKFVKMLQETNSELRQAKIHFLEIDELESITEDQFDLALIIGTLDHVYRCFNIDKQSNFSDFIRSNSKAAIWEIPVFEQNAHWNWSLPENMFALLERFSYLKELDWLRSHSRGELRPIIFSSDDLIFSSNYIMQINDQNIFQKHQYADGNACSRKTFRVGESIIKTEIHPKNMGDSSEIFLESKFLVKWHAQSLDPLGFPKIKGIEKGVCISQFEREAISGKRLDEVASESNAYQILQAFLKLASELAKLGVFPNDLRPWNVLWDGSKCHIIDFSSSDYFDRDVLFIPQVVSFLAVADYIISAKLGAPKWRLTEIMDELSKNNFLYSELRELIFDFAWIEIISDDQFLNSLPYSDVNLTLVNILAKIEEVWSLRLDESD